MSTYIRYPSTSGGVPKYATVGDLPSNAAQGDLAVVLADNGLYEYDGASWVLITGSGSVITTVSDTDSIDLTVSSGDLTADLKLSATSAGAGELKITNSLENDGLLSIIDIADTSTTGALSSTDWNTFNGKQASGNYITALTGDATAAGPGSSAITLATVNSNVGSFGGATSVSAITVNAKGLVTAAASTSIQIAESQVTNLVTDLAGKLTTTLTSANVFVGNGSNVATGVAITGDIGITNAGVTSIATGVIVNADVNASAAIDFAKLAALSSGNILVGSVGNVATSVAVTGDVTISNAGVTAIASGVIVNADVNASAAIDGTKISPNFGSQNVVTTGTLAAGATDINGTLNILAQNALRLQDTTGGQYVGFIAAGTTTTHTLTMPAAAPAVNRVFMGGGSTATDLQWGGANTTFTPAVSPASGAYSGLTYSVQKGNYVRLGDWIMFTIQIEISAVNINTATGALNITGLPVAQKTDSGLETSFVCANSNLNTSTGKPLVTARLASAATTINLYESGDATAEAVVGADAITGGSFNKKIQISGCYPAA